MNAISNMFNPGKPDMMGQGFGQPQNGGIVPPMGHPPQVQDQGYGAMGYGGMGQGFGQGQWMQNRGFGQGFGGGFGQGFGGFGQGQGNALGFVMGHFVGDWPDIKPVLDFISARPALALAYGLSGGFFFWNMNR